MFHPSRKLFSRFTSISLHFSYAFGTVNPFRSLASVHSSPKKHLHVHPDSCLQDEILHIKVKDLSPGAEVTLTSSIKDARGQTFFTYTHYRANDSGSINLETDGSVGGSYSGVFPMGPIAALSPGPKEHKYLRFLKKDVSTPLEVDFKLHKGHIDAVKACYPEPEQVIDTATHRRIYMAPGVQRIPIRQGKLRATLFLPEGDGPFPGVIDLFGTAGGLIEFRGAQLASRGIAALSLAYLDFEDIPAHLDVLDISYFEEAVQFLMANEKVKKTGVGAIGISKGADLACSMGALIPEVKAVICINGIPVNTWCPLKTRDKTYPGLHFDISRGKIINQDLVSTIDMMDDSESFPETYVPLHESDASFLFIVGLEDRNWKTELETTRAVQKMKAHGKTSYEVLSYKETGHLIEAPYAPFSYATYHKMAGTGLIWGGALKGHTDAQVHSWSRMLQFIKEKV